MSARGRRRGRRETLEVAGGEPDAVTDLELQYGLGGDVLDHVVPTQDAVVVDQRLGEQLDLVERIAVLARDHPDPMHGGDG
jgi:hypothetical protein